MTTIEYNYGSDSHQFAEMIKADPASHFFCPTFAERLFVAKHESVMVNEKHGMLRVE